MNIEIKGKRTAIIMAGGSGERFWPLSRKRKPKQLLKLASEEKTMLEESIERISELIPPEDVYIVTSETILETIRRAIPILPEENVIAEPHKRNTAPCLALGAAFIKAKYGKMGFSAENISIAVLTADQSVSPKEGFVETVDAIMRFVEDKDELGVIGIPPSRPETGYGYIETAEPIEGDSPTKSIKKVLSFTEKPSLETARKYLEKENYLWNSGMFFWRLDFFIDEMKRRLPEVGGKIDLMAEKYKNKTHFALPGALESVSDIFEAFPNISIDFGLMEKTRDAAVVKAFFEWDDVGSWDSLDRIREMDENNNIVEGEASLLDSKNTTVINSSSGRKIIVAGLGLENMIVAATDDAVLICPKSQAQNVKKSVADIKEKFSNKWL